MKQKYELHDLCHYFGRSSLEEIKQCLNDKETDINLLDEQGHTALFYAVQERENEIVKYLLAQKADPNKAGLNSFPPLS